MYKVTRILRIKYLIYYEIGINLEGHCLNHEYASSMNM